MPGSGDITLYLGEASWTERQVGAVAPDGTVYAGATTWNRETVGFVDGDGAVYAGEQSWNRSQVGSTDSSGMIFRGESQWSQSPVGKTDSDGKVWRGSSGFGGDLVGRVDPPDRRAGAALLLLVEGRPTGEPGHSTTADMDAGSSRSDSDAVAKAAGVATGAVVGGLVSAFQHHRKQQRAATPPSPPHDPAAPRARVPAPPADDEPFEQRRRPVEISTIAPNVGSDEDLHPEMKDIFDALRQFGTKAVDDPNAGLEFGYRRGVLYRDELLVTLWRWHQMGRAIATGRAQPTPDSLGQLVIPPPPGEWFVTGWRSYSDSGSPG